MATYLAEHGFIRSDFAIRFLLFHSIPIPGKSLKCPISRLLLFAPGIRLQLCTQGNIDILITIQSKTMTWCRKLQSKSTQCTQCSFFRTKATASDKSTFLIYMKRKCTQKETKFDYNFVPADAISLASRTSFKVCSQVFEQFILLFWKWPLTVMRWLWKIN